MEQTRHCSNTIIILYIYISSQFSPVDALIIYYRSRLTLRSCLTIGAFNARILLFYNRSVFGKRLKQQWERVMHTNTSNTREQHLSAEYFKMFGKNGNGSFFYVSTTYIIVNVVLFGFYSWITTSLDKDSKK